MAAIELIGGCEIPAISYGVNEGTSDGGGVEKEALNDVDGMQGGGACCVMLRDDIGVKDGACGTKVDDAGVGVVGGACGTKVDDACVGLCDIVGVGVGV